MMHKANHTNYIFSSDKANRTESENRKIYADAFRKLQARGYEAHQTYGKFQGTIENAFIVTVSDADPQAQRSLHSYIAHGLQQDAFIAQDAHGRFTLNTYANGAFIATPATYKNVLNPPAHESEDYTYLPKNGKYLYLRF